MNTIGSIFLTLILCCCILLIILLITSIFLFINYGTEFIQVISTVVFIRDIMKLFFPKIFSQSSKVVKGSKDIKNSTPSKSYIEDAEFREISNKN